MFLACKWQLSEPRFHCKMGIIVPVLQDMHRMSGAKCSKILIAREVQRIELMQIRDKGLGPGGVGMACFFTEERK